jgi:hypothetical protein
MVESALKFLGGCIGFLLLLLTASGCRPANDQVIFENTCDTASGLMTACGMCDPYPHCVSPLSCMSSAECPSGTYCNTSFEKGDAPWPDADGGNRFNTCSTSFSSSESSPAMGRCEVPISKGAARHALTDGFRVSGFSLVPTDDTGSSFAAFSFEAPKETVLVHCALFSCPPEVLKVGYRQTNFNQEEQDGSIYEVINFRQCALASALYESRNGVFDLGDDANGFTDKSGVKCERALSRKRIVTDLLVGCWAFGPAGVIGASPLEVVSPRAVHNFSGTFDLDCDDEENGAACEPTFGRAFGVCEDGTCFNTCVDHRDCELLIPAVTGTAMGDGGGISDGGVSPMTVPRFRCVKSDGAFVGICHREGAVDGGEEGAL